MQEQIPGVYICDNPETVTIKFSPTDPRRHITYGYIGDPNSDQNVVGDKIEVQMNGSVRTIRCRFAFTGQNQPDCKINLSGTGGGNFRATSVDPVLEDGGSRTFKFKVS